MVAVLSELRLRSRVDPKAIEPMVGKILTDNEYDTLLTGPCRILKPDGRPLAVYLPGALETPLLDATYGTLHGFKSMMTDNRGMASGSKRIKDGNRTRSKLVASSIIGAFDPSPRFNYCRLTAWSGKEIEKYRDLFPLFEAIAGHFAEHVPDRFGVQMGFVNKTHPDWRIGNTPFTTVTVNNSYPTGVHTDAGDLNEGFSTLAVLRKGSYSGGRLVFPEFRVAVDMGHGDVLLMDAHEWHGNTAMTMHDQVCNACNERATVELTVQLKGAPRPLARPFCETDAKRVRDGMDYDVQSERRLEAAERISVVSYYRTKMAGCGSFDEEAEKAAINAEQKSGNIIDEMAEEAAAVRTVGA